MNNMKRGIAFLLSILLLVDIMPMRISATEIAPTTIMETISETTEETIPETTEETIPETTEEPVSETTEEPVSETTEETGPEDTSEVVSELVKVSCIGKHVQNDELVDSNDSFSAEGYNLRGISAIWANGYDDLLTELYGDSRYASPYAVDVEGYKPGEEITLTVAMTADILIQENVAVYYIDSDANYQRIDNVMVREVQQEGVLFTEVEFTVNALGVFAIGNESATHFWTDNGIDFYASAYGLTGFTAVDQKANVNTDKAFEDYICYTIIPESEYVLDPVSYTVTVPEKFDADNLTLYAVTTEGLSPIAFTMEGGMVFFEYSGEFTFICGVAAQPDGYTLIGLELSGNLPTDCFVGENISLADATVTAVYGKDDDVYTKVLHPNVSDGYTFFADTSKVGQATVYVYFGTAAMTTFTINVHQQKFEDSETGVQVDVDGFGITNVSVSVMENELFDQSPLLNYMENFVAYDIDLSGYQQGDTAVVTLPIPEGIMNPAVYYVSDDGTKVVRMSATVNGDGTISFETNHFSTYAVGEGRYDPNEVESENYEGTNIVLQSQTATRPGSQDTEWKKVNELKAGKEYLIVSTGSEGTGHAFGNNGGTITAPEITVESDNTIKNENVTSGIVWTVGGSSNNWTFQNGDSYIRRNSNALQLGTDNSSNTFKFSGDNNRLYYTTGIIFNRKTYYLTYVNNWTIKQDGGNVYFYEKIEYPDILYSAEGEDKPKVPAIAGNQLELSSALKANSEGTITDVTDITPSYEVVDGKGDANILSINGGVATLTGKVGTAVVKVTYERGNLVVWDEFVISTQAPEYKLELCKPKQDGNNTVYEPITAPIVKKNVQNGDTDSIWAVITVNGEDLGELSDEQLKKLSFVSSNESIATVDSKTGVVTFHGGEGSVRIMAIYEYENGKSVTDTVVYSVSKDLNVVPEDGTTDFPEYPNEGSIRFDKHATAVGNFADTGMAQVELSMTGVPFTSGNEIDVVIMLDISTSMADVTNRVSNTVKAAQEALKLLVTNEDGTFNGNRVAIYGFCGWDTECDGNYQDDYTPYVEYIAGDKLPSGGYNVYEMAGLQTYDDRKLTDANNAIKNRYNNLGNGTNYAAALKQCYETLNATRTDGREQYLIFMTDGAPSTGFAYVNNRGSKSVYTAKNLTNDGYGASDRYNYDNIDVIDLVLLNEYYSVLMKNAGVDIYTVAMQIQSTSTNQTTAAKETAASHTLLENIATDSDHALVVGANDDPSKVVDVFKQIAQEIKQAATDVKVTDKIADDYTMVFAPPNAEVGNNDGNQEYYIEVREYQLNAETDSNGNVVDYSRGSYDSKMKLYMGVNTVNGKQTYYAATAANSTGNKNMFALPAFDTTPLGTLYYWTTDSTKGDSGISIVGKDNKTYYFVSTGTGTHNMISGAYAKGDIVESDIVVTNANGTQTTQKNKTSPKLIIATPYFVYNAETRLLVWTADKLSSTELALSYFLYLDQSGGHSGSINEKPAGTYETNDYAYLEYTNFQGNRCEQVFPIPQMTWNGAQVSYVFYLVNKQGQPVNRAGRVVPFSEAVYVTDVSTYSITWNKLETTDALEANRLAKDLVPDVYKLYDEKAAYKIHVYEDEGQANLNNHFWIIDGGNTTYVYNTKSDAVKYTAPGVYAEGGNFLCRGEGTVTVKTDASGHITSASYTKASGETQKKFTSAPSGVAFFDGTYAYFKGKDADGNDTYYTIVERKNATRVATGFDFSNTTVAFAVMWLPELVEDTVVIDYGLDVIVDVAINDALTSQILGVFNEKPNDVEINKGSYRDRKSNDGPIDLGVTVGSEKLKVGMAYADSQNSVRVSLDKSTGMQVKDPLVFYYESEVSYYSGNNSETLNTDLMYSSVTVVPATTIYYEDEYVILSSESKESGSWKAVTGGSGWDAESQAATSVQATDRPGENKVSELYDADNLYGYDPAYSKCSTYSLGNAAKFTANLTKRGTATFEFYGTGFDVIAATSNTTGTIIVKVYPWENGKYSTTASRSYIVDTYYGYSYKGINTETGKPKWEVATNNPNALYQVPVMKVADLTYGRYKAEIQIRYSPAFNHTGTDSYEFYLDAIRIYDPAGDGDQIVSSKTDKNGQVTNTTVADIYKQDGEGWPVYAELRNWIIDAGTYDSFTGDDVTGVVFIDGMGSNAKVEDYKNFGPNNELYLANGQAVSFYLNGLNAKTIQLAMKSVGGTANAKIWYIEGGAAKDYKSYNLATATDMYYDITALKGKHVVIRNEGDSILSITNVKMTFASSSDRPASVEKIAQVMSVDRSGTEAVLMFLRNPVQEAPPIIDAPETNVPETNVPETNVPEINDSETNDSETNDSETNDSETKVPDTKVPETKVPETKVPDTKVPETKVPDTKVPETNVPEITEPEKDQHDSHKEEQQNSASEQDSPEAKMTLWEMIVEWFTNLFNFIIGLFGGRN